MGRRTREGEGEAAGAGFPRGARLATREVWQYPRRTGVRARGWGVGTEGRQKSQSSSQTRLLSLHSSYKIYRRVATALTRKYGFTSLKPTRARGLNARKHFRLDDKQNH